MTASSAGVQAALAFKLRTFFPQRSYFNYFFQSTPPSGNAFCQLLLSNKLLEAFSGPMAVPSCYCSGRVGRRLPAARTDCPALVWLPSPPPSLNMLSTKSLTVIKQKIPVSSAFLPLVAFVSPGESPGDR